MSERLDEQAITVATNADSHAQEEAIIEDRLPRWVKIAAIVGFLLCLLIYVLRLDAAVGMFVDDAWYVMLAKGLATGQGYSLINAPTPGITPLYPPVFPFLLSLLYRLSPQFPQNVWLLKSLSVASMLIAGALAFVYFTRERRQHSYNALGIAAAVTLSPPLVLLATSTLMSECVFVAIFLATILVVERSVRAIGSGQTNVAKVELRYGLLMGVMGALCFLTRSVSAVVVAAIFVYLLKQRLRRAALIFAATVALLAAPWVIYSRLHAPTPEQWQEQAGHIVEDYSKQFWQRQAGNVASGTIEVADLPARVWNNVMQIAFRDTLRVVAAPFYEFLRSLQAAEAWRQQDGYEMPGGITATMSLIVALLALAGFILTIRERTTVAEIAVIFTLGITLVWPWEPFRFLLPLAPLLIFYVLRGIAAVHRLHQKMRQQELRPSPAVLGIAAACILAVNLYGNIVYLSRKLSGNQPSFLSAFDENEKLFIWARDHLPRNEVIATSNPGLVYLYTGNKTVAFHNPAGNWDKWKQMNVRYLIRTSTFILPPTDADERGMSVLYRAPGVLNLRVVDFGPAETRSPWGVVSSSSPRN
ncbi:MAG: hypothetical protein ABI977_24870 [Acidobacteriota bacterium]